MIVLDDADPATVAEAIKIGGYFNSGQDCTASSRILVAERIYDDVLVEHRDARSSRSPSAIPATDDEIGMGPVISAEQQERVLGFLERAVDAKATVADGRRGASATAASSSSRRSSRTSHRTPRSCRTRSSGRS